MTPPSDYKWLTRRRILKQAMILFRRHGYHGVGLDAIMKAANLTKGAFYVHFESKEDLFLNVLKEDSLLERLLEDSPADESLAVCLARWLSPEQWEDLGEGCSLALLAADAARGNQIIHEEMAAKCARLTVALAQRLPPGVRPAQERAETLLALLTGTALLMNAQPSSDERARLAGIGLKSALDLAGLEEDAMPEAWPRPQPGAGAVEIPPEYR